MALEVTHCTTLITACIVILSCGEKMLMSSNEDKLQKMNPFALFAYQPFSKGKRNCIGQTFAVLEARTLLAMLYSKFSFQYAGSEPERQVHNVTSHPKDESS
ncbi:hypothetical protein CEUSTIGMA_g3851.t1 [Chlamydomonas eustigma]|uniref:Cytochrome P450 n=1 Tax=Chlamydomonas eustigma TaxID=1157962 RepID=A0A250X024_9CHLO|nr:hypothetical protein CEUSTIGMA_g3851.t1 [Chlamydomonas eustigma]|eukprot:GAX76406.1 hypothetical protein CEUSTIGMA_g3851.t1 [Chlamydomonas eustigma]